MTSLIGILYTIAFGVFSLMNGVFIKKVSSIKPIELCFWRTAIQIIFVWPVCWYRQSKGYTEGLEFIYRMQIMSLNYRPKQKEQ